MNIAKSKGRGNNAATETTRQRVLVVREGQSGVVWLRMLGLYVDALMTLMSARTVNGEVTWWKKNAMEIGNADQHRLTYRWTAPSTERCSKGGGNSKSTQNSYTTTRSRS